MGTKNNPGKYDCYEKAEPDEPIFTLRANDPSAAQVIRYWVTLKHKENGGLATEKLEEAMNCADSMEQWRSRRGK